MVAGGCWWLLVVAGGGLGRSRDVSHNSAGCGTWDPTLKFKLQATHLSWPNLKQDCGTWDVGSYKPCNHPG